MKSEKTARKILFLEEDKRYKGSFPQYLRRKVF